MKYKLGLDLGGTNMVAAVVDQEYRIVSRASRPTGAGRSVEEITHDMAAVSQEAAAVLGLSLNDFPYWGIGMPSCVNPKTGKLVHSNNLGWKNLPLHQFLERLTNIPIKIENDANCAVLGETLAGAGKSCRNVIMLTLGTGVGGGIIIDGALYTGADKMGVEPGHTKLVHGGRLCTCGKRGCLESYCSAAALKDLCIDAAENLPAEKLLELCGGELNSLDGSMIFSAAKVGDPAAISAVSQYSDYLAGGISTFVTIFRPEVVILGGGISCAGEFLLNMVNERLFEYTFAAQEIGVPPIISASLGNDAGLIGAAYLS